MKNDLIERYVYAVTKRLPAKNRQDVSQELESLIDDMLTERCGERAPTDKDIRVILTELGTPNELYAKYDEDADKSLIGQPYYSTYKFVIKIVLISVAVGLTVANLILQIMEPKSGFEAVAQWGAQVYDSLLAAFAIVTLLFAVFSRKGINLDEGFNLNSLPAVPKKTQEIPVWESVWGIVLCVVFVAVMLMVPQVFCAITTNGEVTSMVPIFDTQVLRGGWYLIVAFGALGIIREVVNLMERRYNKKVMLTSVVTDTASAVLSILWLNNDSIINPDFRSNMQVLFAGESDFICNIFEKFNLFFLFFILLALALDAAFAVYKTLRK